MLVGWDPLSSLSSIHIGFSSPFVSVEDHEKESPLFIAFSEINYQQVIDLSTLAANKLIG